MSHFWSYHLIKQNFCEPCFLPIIELINDYLFTVNECLNNHRLPYKLKLLWPYNFNCHLQFVHHFANSFSEIFQSTLYFFFVYGIYIQKDTSDAVKHDEDTAVGQDLAYSFIHWWSVTKFLVLATTGYQATPLDMHLVACCRTYTDRKHGNPPSKKSVKIDFFTNTSCEYV